MSETLTAVPASAKPLRSDGQEARNRLLDAALGLFADKGFAKTSIREIAQAAQVNVASISYYFGDKDGLYRAVWTDPRCNPDCGFANGADSDVSLTDALRGMLRGFVEPLKQGELTQRFMKLHFREMLEPTGVWQQEIDNNIKPSHMALVSLLCRHLGVDQADDDIHRLCFSIAGLGMMLHVAGDVFTAIRPELVASPEALDVYGDRLLTYALAVVEAERLRRVALPPASLSSKPPRKSTQKPNP
ncbi:MAG: TetR family transcriptional regulator [Burkholderiales bacterium PBB3]|nr:MAG: TetR family transcriptional regulator [Burkholderiales bacterium PBB3]